MSHLIGEPGVSERLRRTLQLRSSRFAVTELDETLVPVVVVDTLTPHDPRVDGLAKRFSTGGTQAAVAAQHSAFHMRTLQSDRVLRIKRLIVTASAFSVVRVGLTTPAAFDTVGTLFATASSHSRTRATTPGGLFMNSGAWLPASRPPPNLGDLYALRVNGGVVVDLNDLDISIDRTASPTHLFVVAEAVNTEVSVSVVWDEEGLGLG